MNQVQLDLYIETPNKFWLTSKRLTFEGADSFGSREGRGEVKRVREFPIHTLQVQQLSLSHNLISNWVSELLDYCYDITELHDYTYGI